MEKLKENPTRLIESWEESAKAHNMTLNDLARIGNIDRTQLFRWRTKIPKSLKTYFAIEEYLKELKEIKSKTE